MVIEAACSACGHPMKVPAETTGELVKCVYCGAETRIAKAAAPPPLPMAMPAAAVALEAVPPALPAAEPSNRPSPSPAGKLGGGPATLALAVVMVTACGLLLNVILLVTTFNGILRHQSGSLFALVDALTGLAAWGCVVYALTEFYAVKPAAPRALVLSLSANLGRAIAFWVASIIAFGLVLPDTGHNGAVIYGYLGFAVFDSLFVLFVAAYIGTSRSVRESFARR